MERIKLTEERGVSYPSTDIKDFLSTVFLADGCNKLHKKHFHHFLHQTYRGFSLCGHIKPHIRKPSLKFPALTFTYHFTNMSVPKLSFTFLSCASEYPAISPLAASRENVVLFQI